jgi:hypothetical protein
LVLNLPVCYVVFQNEIFFFAVQLGLWQCPLPCHGWLFIYGWGFARLNYIWWFVRQVNNKSFLKYELLPICMNSIIIASIFSFFRFGRRPIFFLSLVLQVVFGLLAAAATEYYTFAFCRLVIGSTTSGVFLVAYVIGEYMKFHDNYKW